MSATYDPRPDDAMDVTWLGWQGWVVSTATTQIMIDGLLVPTVGRGPANARVEFPIPRARRLVCDELTLDAYLITHEHEDHFSVPSLARLDRRIPLYVSARVSRAARTLLAEMSFVTHYIEAGTSFTVGDIHVQFFGGVHHPIPQGDEWDAMAFIVRSRGKGLFWSNVDIRPPPAMHALLEQLGRGEDAPPLLASESGRLQMWSPDETGAEGERNGIPDSTSAGTLATAETSLAVLRAGRSVIPHCGITVRMRGDTLDTVLDRTAFVYTEQVELGPPQRPFVKNADDELEPPRTGPATISDQERAELAGHLKEFAEFLYGRELYATLYSLTALGDTSVRRTFAFILLCGDDQDDVVLSYEPAACAFEALEGDADEIEDAFVGTALMWARDYLSIARGVIEPRAVGLEYAEQSAFDGTLFWTSMWQMYHPQRIPERVLAQYRRVLAQERDTAVQVRLP